VTIKAVTPTEIVDGIGPTVSLAPGERRLFRFTVDGERTVGIGILATPDTAAATLYGVDGSTIATGVAAMRTLPAGGYLLAIEARADGPPITARPALVGLKPPDNGPPPEVAAAYRQGAEGPVAVPAPARPRTAGDGEGEP
jgi:hypothetical protein